MSRSLVASVAIAMLVSLKVAVPQAEALEAILPVQRASFEVGGVHIVAYVPWDLRAGETVSGAVTLDGAEAQEKALEGFQLNINGSTYPLQAKSWSRTLGARTRVLRVQVVDPHHQPIALAVFKVDPLLVVPQPGSNQPELPVPLPRLMHRLSGFHVPNEAVGGGIFRIQGPFNGTLNDNVVWIGHKRVPILAESARFMAVRAPKELEGKQTIVVWNAGVTASSAVRLVKSLPPTGNTPWNVITSEFVATVRISPGQALGDLCAWVAEAKADFRELQSTRDGTAATNGDTEGLPPRSAQDLSRCCPAAATDLRTAKVCVDKALAAVKAPTRGKAVWSRGVAYLDRAIKSASTADPDCELVESTLDYIGRLAQATSQGRLLHDVSQAQGVCHAAWLGRRAEVDIKSSLEAIRTVLGQLQRPISALGENHSSSQKRTGPQ